jgi:HAD superfamily hydrolase (TIGR01484 family)
MPDLTQKHVVLATDLDGTFLGGTPQQKDDLYNYIEKNREWLGLVFVTGRDLDFIDEITQKDVPRPDAVIGDVGTTVVSGIDFSPIDAVETWIDERWKGADHASRILGDAPHLKLQEGFGGRRVSYFYEDEAAAKVSAEALEAEGYDVLMSDGIYFDILPRGVQKGPTLKQFIAAHDLPAQKILVAGDTLNDRSLFETGMDGVVVANAEEALLASISGLPNVHFSEFDGAGGVFDGLQRKLELLAELELPNV